MKRWPEVLIFPFVLAASMDSAIAGFGLHGSSSGLVVISNVSSGTPTSAAATITANYSPAAEGYACYGLTTSYELGCTTPDATPITSGTMNLFFLTPSTTYHYQVYAAASGYVTGSSGDRTFTTAASSTTVVISLTSVVPSSTSALINWVNTTSIPGAKGQVCTGPNGGPYTTCTTRDATNIVNDTATLSSLSPSTTYYYEINATATGYTQGFSSQQTFTTPASGTVYSVDYVAGSDSNAGTSQGAAWQHIPGDPKATGVPLSKARTLQPNDEVQVKGGQIYYGEVLASSIGTAGNQIVFEGSGWNGQAKMTGLTVDCLTFTSDGTFSGVSDAVLPSSPNMIPQSGQNGGFPIASYNAFTNIITLDPVTSCTPGTQNPSTLSGATIFMSNNGTTNATQLWDTVGNITYSPSQITNVSGSSFTISDAAGCASTSSCFATQLANLTTAQILSLEVHFYNSGQNDYTEGVITGTVGSPITGLNITTTVSVSPNTCTNGGSLCYTYMVRNNPNYVNQTLGGQNWVAPAYAIEPSPTGSFTPVFGTNTISGLTAANFPPGTAVVFYDTGGSLPTGISPSTPYLIITSSSTVATIGTVAAPRTALTFTGPGTGTQTATPQNLLMAKIAPGSYYVGVSMLPNGFIDADNGSYWTVDGFEIFGYANTSGVIVYGRSNGVQVTNNNLHDDAGTGALGVVRLVGNIGAGQRNAGYVISGNTIGPNTTNQPGISINQSINAVVSNNNVGPTWWDPLYSSQNINFTASGNHLHDSTSAHSIGITYYSGGTALFVESQNVTITNNDIENVTAGMLAEGDVQFPSISVTSAYNATDCGITPSSTQVTFCWSSPSFTWPVGQPITVTGTNVSTWNTSGAYPATGSFYAVQASTTTSVTVNNTHAGTYASGGTIQTPYSWYNNNYTTTNNIIQGVASGGTCFGDGSAENGSLYKGNICDSGNTNIHAGANALQFTQNILNTYGTSSPAASATFTNNASETCSGLTNPSPCPGTAVPPNTAPNSGNVINTSLLAAIAAMPTYASGGGPMGSTICQYLPSGTYGVNRTCP